MGIFLRLILVFSLLVQSLPGLMGSPCAPMARPAQQLGSHRVAEQPCCCCSGMMSADCPMAARRMMANRATACDCLASGQEQPQTPPLGPEHKPLAQALALLPILTAVLPPRAAPKIAPRSEDSSLCRSAPSIQSLLCVWVV